MQVFKMSKKALIIIVLIIFILIAITASLFKMKLNFRLFNFGRHQVLTQEEIASTPDEELVYTV